MQLGKRVYCKEIKNVIDNYSGIVLEDLGDQLIVQIRGCNVYLQKERVLESLEQLLDVRSD